MTTFSEIIVSKNVKPAFLKKQAAVADVENSILAITDLDTVTPNPRTFHRMEIAANKSLEELKTAITDLDILLLNSDPDIMSNEDYVADKKLNRDCQFRVFKAIDDYIDIMTAKEVTYPPDMGVKPAAPPSDLSDVLKQLVKCQEDNAKAAAENAKAAADSAKATADQLAVNATQHKETIDPA